MSHSFDAFTLLISIPTFIIHINIHLRKLLDSISGGSRINFRVLQNFTKKIEHRNDAICRKIIDSARSKKIQF